MERIRCIMCSRTTSDPDNILLICYVCGITIHLRCTSPIEYNVYEHPWLCKCCDASWKREMERSDHSSLTLFKKEFLRNLQNSDKKKVKTRFRSHSDPLICGTYRYWAKKPRRSKSSHYIFDFKSVDMMVRVLSSSNLCYFFWTKATIIENNYKYDFCPVLCSSSNDVAL